MGETTGVHPSMDVAAGSYGYADRAMSSATPGHALPWYRRRGVVDASVAVVLTVITATGSFGSSDLFGPNLLGPDARYPPPWLGLPMGVALGLLAWWRRRLTVVFLLAALVTNAFVSAQLAVMFTLYSLAERTTSRVKVTVAVIIAVVAVGVPIWSYAGLDGAVPLTVVICIAPALFGLYVGTRRDLIARIRERAERAEREQQRRIAQARSEERTQIARDMHDVVTHRVALMVMQATALETSDGQGAVAAGTQIGATGREALAELRSLVGILRNDDDVPMRPRPDLRDLNALIDESRQLGIPVTLEVVNESGLRPPLLVEHTIYRVVQEALTNVHKHAGGARTRIRVEHAPDELLLSITNGRGTQPAERAELLGGGHGLLGLTERIRLVGGELTADHTPDGGFQILASVPMQESP